MSAAAYSHVWRAADADYPCTPTGVEQSDENIESGRVYAQVRTPEGGQNFVPKDQLVTVAAQKAETKAAAKAGNGAGTAPDALQPNPTASVAFLRAIMPAGPWPLTSIVPDGVTNTRTFEATDEVNAIEFIMSENTAGKGLYYTSADCGRPISKPAKGDLIGARLLHVDSDPREDETVEDAKARALAAYRAHDRPPSYIVDSGNGLQAGWLLSRKFPFPQVPPGPNNPARKKRIEANVKPIEDRNKALAAAVGAPVGTANADRLLRLPHTINWPNATKKKLGRTPCMTSVVEMTGVRYAVEDFPTSIGLAPDGKAKKARDESRSAKAFHEGAMLVGFGADYEEMRDRLLNHRDPGIADWAHEKGMANDEREMRRIWDKAPAGSAAEDGDDGQEDEESDDDNLLAQRMPTIDPKAFYGVLGPLVTATTMRSEATKVGVALQTISHVSLTMRPFFKPRGDGNVPYNIYAVQIGPSGAGRKGTSAEVADNHLGPAIIRLARTVEAQLAFTDEDGMMRQDAESAVAAASRKLEWVKSACAFTVAETEAALDNLGKEGAEATAEIKKYKAALARTKSPRTMKECKAAIADTEARIADIVDRIAESEAYLAEMQAVLADQPGRIAEAEKTHATAVKVLAALPLSDKPPDEPWRALFASLAKGPVTARGISTGEGLVELIRDPGIKAGNHGPVHDPGVDNKILFINMEELGGVLAVSTRPGATLSTMLRTGFDCKPLELINKTSPLRCQAPYIVLAAGVTPAEFMGRLFDKGDTAYSADNGLGNRFFGCWTLRDRIEPKPRSTPGLSEMMDGIAANVLKVYETLKPTEPFLSTALDFSSEAEALYSQWYVENETRAATSPNAAKLIKRKTVHLWKIAGVLAVMNGESEISAGAFEAARAWSDYATATIDAIASTAAERKKMKVLTDDGKRVLEAAKELGADEAPVSVREARRKTPFDKKRFDAAVTSLLRMGPSPITIQEEEYTSGTGVRQTRALISLRPATEATVSDAGRDEAY